MKLVITLFLALTCSCANAQVSRDLDGDNLSDQLTANVSSPITWSVISSATKATLLQQSFGVATDVLIPGRWESSATYNVGVVRSDPETNALVWKILKDDGTIFQSSLGALGDIIISGGDFNGDGVTDAALLHVNSSGGLEWTVVQDFAGTSPKKIKFAKGKNSIGGRAFFLSLNGVRDVLAIFHPDASGKSASLLIIDPKTKKSSSLGSFRSRLAAGAKPRPIPVKGEDGKSRLAFVTSDATDTTVEIYTTRGRLVSKVTVPGKGAVVAGDYLDTEPGEELALQNGSTVLYFNPFTQNKESDTGVNGTIQGEVQVVATEAVLPTPTPAPTATATPVP